MRIVLILPSTSSGGLERVMTELAWHFSEQEGIEVNLISLSKGDFFYPLPQKIRIFSPSFSLQDTIRPLFLVRLMIWLRKHVKSVDPDSLLCFGGKFNSFVLLSILGLGVNCYISDRSRPTISYGWFLDFLNPVMYRKAAGIICQTRFAEEIMKKRIGHQNIRVIGNPLRINEEKLYLKENIILNVGRFISSKHQELLVRYFADLRPVGWKLIFLGDGPKLEDVQNLAYDLELNEKTEFLGAKQSIRDYYFSSKIFAFTSLSEGFPNVLGEAMAAGLACISFDCEAGPSDLIDNGENGFLISPYDHEEYKHKLKLLIENESLRNKFGTRAKEKALKYRTDHIGDQYLKFLTKN
jgi:glycosyltransferase involved in cell wall biosynthesis